MISRRIAAALVVLGTLAAAVAIAAGTDDTADPGVAQASQPLVTTTSEPDFAALVESGAYHVLSEEEAELTGEALTRSTSTTTTTVVATTTTVAPSTTAAPRATPTTKAPPPAPPPASDAGFRSGAEGEFASSINAFRGANGLASLSRQGSLDAYARAWAENMAEQGGLSHSNIGSLLPPWSAVGENVGQGGSVGGIFDALVASEGHRANMLDDFTHMGIGVWQDSRGVYWTAHVFTR